jgi:hypothetical protein
MSFITYKDLAGICIFGLLIAVPLAIIGLPVTLPLGITGIFFASLFAANR